MISDIRGKRSFRGFFVVSTDQCMNDSVMREKDFLELTLKFNTIIFLPTHGSETSVHPGGSSYVSA